MGLTGFRVKSPIGKAFRAIGGIRASEFEPDVLQFLRKSLGTAIQLTPARSLATIKKNQRKQYKRRINYIPSFHTLIDPSLIVKEDDSQWLYREGKWYRPDVWNLPQDVWNDYEVLNRERERRMEKSESKFIDERAQARFLFKRSWYEIGESAGVNVSCPANVRDSVTRRNPPINPPRGYAQKRGGKDAFSIVIRNPLLDKTSSGGNAPLSTEQYKPFNGQEIIGRAMAIHRPDFENKVADKTKKLILRILKAVL